MARKIIALLTIVAFLLFSWACVYHTARRKSWQDVAAKKPERIEIVAIQKKSGEYIEFSKKKAARIQGEFLVGEGRLKNFEIEQALVKNLKKLYSPSKWSRWETYELTTRDGKSYKVISYKKKKDKYICDVEISESIPLTDIDLVWVKRVNKPITFLLNALWVIPATTIVLIGVVAVSIAQGGSYSVNKKGTGSF